MTSGDAKARRRNTGGYCPSLLGSIGLPSQSRTACPITWAIPLDRSLADDARHAYIEPQTRTGAGRYGLSYAGNDNTPPPWEEAPRLIPAIIRGERGTGRMLEALRPADAPSHHRSSSRWAGRALLKICPHGCSGWLARCNRAAIENSEHMIDHICRFGEKMSVQPIRGGLPQNRNCQSLVDGRHVGVWMVLK